MTGVVLLTRTTPTPTSRPAKRVEQHGPERRGEAVEPARQDLDVPTGEELLAYAPHQHGQEQQGDVGDEQQRRSGGASRNFGRSRRLRRTSRRGGQPRAQASYQGSRSWPMRQGH